MYMNFFFMIFRYDYYLLNCNLFPLSFKNLLYYRPKYKNIYIWMYIMCKCTSTVYWAWTKRKWLWINHLSGSKYESTDIEQKWTLPKRESNFSFAGNNNVIYMLSLSLSLSLSPPPLFLSLYVLLNIYSKSNQLKLN